MEDDSSRDETKDIAIDEAESENSNAGSQSDEPQVTKPKTSRFAHLENIDFQFEAYDQDICILGSKGSGKSYLANAIMKSLNGINVWVYDFNFQFHSSRAIVVHELDELRVKMPAPGPAAFRCPVDDLRTAMGEFRYGYVALHLAGNSVGKAQLRAEGVVVTSEAQGFPSFGNVIAAAKVILVGDPGVVSEEGLLTLEGT